MYTTTHTSISLMILTLLPNYIGVVLAIASHPIIDILLEIRTRRKHLWIEVMTEGIFCLAGLYLSYKFDFMTLFIVASLAGNLFDIIDYTLLYTVGKKKLFCHLPGYPGIWWGSKFNGISLKSHFNTRFFDLLVFILAVLGVVLL